MSKLTSRLPLLLSLAFVFLATLYAQQTHTPQTTSQPSYSVIPAEAAKQANPVKSSPESLARAAKWWTLDCAMCHGKNGNGKSDMASDMKLKLADFTDPNSLKDRTDGELFYIVKNGHQDMPPEGGRVKPEENSILWAPQGHAARSNGRYVWRK